MILKDLAKALNYEAEQMRLSIGY